MRYPPWIDSRHFDFQTDAASWWLASAGEDRAHCTPLQEELRADVAVIGAGYTGLNAALRLVQDHSVSTIVLEAGEPGWGASGRNGGFCSPGGAHLEYRTMIRKWGVEETRAFCKAQYAAIDHVAMLGERHGIDYERQGRGEYILGSGPRAAEEAGQQAQWLRKHLGVEARKMDALELAEHGLAGPTFEHGLHLPKGFGLHPLRYSLGLARAAQNAGAILTCRSPVLDWTREGPDHVLRTPQGRVRARRVLLATNGYTPQGIGDPLGSRVMPVFSNILVTRPLSEQELQAQGWSGMEIACDDRALLHYFRLLPGGRFLFGGRGGIRGDSLEEGATRWRIEREFRTLFPAWREVRTEFFWSGLVCLARDMTAHIGEVPGMYGAWYALAYHGGGVSMASWAGAALADLALGTRNGDFDVPSILTRRIPSIPFAALRPVYLRAAYAWFAATEALSGRKLALSREE